jgi:hypothetical protein
LRTPRQHGANIRGMTGETRTANLIASFRASHAAANLGLLVVQSPRRDEILTDVLGLDRGSTLRLGRRDGTYYEGLDVWRSVDGVQDDPDFNLNSLRVWFMVALSAIGQSAAENAYFDRSPELEFLRHLRNGVSHGNRFNLHPGQPSRTASFKSFVIDASLNGSPVLFEFISTGDLMDLFDHLEGHLRSL